MKRNVSIGERFGRLVVAEILPGKNGHTVLRCRCDCGSECTPRQDHILNGRTKSCGCYNREVAKSNNTTHGKSDSKPYNSWVSMKARCENEGNTEYSRYGARGIKVCERWRNSFAEFWKDMGSTYRDGMSIDRIDVNGDYCPENCRWATPVEQANNKRNNFYISRNGETKSLAEWCRICGLRYKSVHARIKAGWDIETALSTPIRKCVR